MKLTAFVEKMFREELGQDKRKQAAKESWCHWHDRSSEIQWSSAINSHVGIHGTCGSAHLQSLKCCALCTSTKVCAKSIERRAFSRSSIRRVVKQDLRLTSRQNTTQGAGHQTTI